MTTVTHNQQAVLLSQDELQLVSGGGQNANAMIGTGATMVGSSIGLAALGAALLGPIGIMTAAGLAFGGGLFIGTGSYYGTVGGASTKPVRSTKRH